MSEWRKYGGQSKKKKLNRNYKNKSGLNGVYQNARSILNGADGLKALVEIRKYILVITETNHWPLNFPGYTISRSDRGGYKDRMGTINND